ncbi:MAG: ABC transporter permease [Anaerolineae bacterium]|jgi:ABC-2 type transport system permease protein
MKPIMVVASHEFRVNVRRPAYIIFTVAVPIIGLIFLLVSAFLGGDMDRIFTGGLDSDSEPIGIVDHSGLFDPLLPGWDDQVTLFADEEAAREALRAERISTMLIVSADYVESGEVAYSTNESGLRKQVALESERVRSLFVEHLTRDALNDDVRARILQSPTYVELDAETGAPAVNGEGEAWLADMMVAYFFGILLIMAVFTASGYLLQGVAEEKDSRVVEIVMSSVSPFELLTGKVLGLGALGLLQVVIWLVAAYALSGGAQGMLGVSFSFTARPEVMVLSLVYFVLGFGIFAALMGAASALGTTQQESQKSASIFSMIAAVPLFLASGLMQNPNSTLFRVLSWFPLTAPTTMLMRLPMTTVPTIDIVGSIVLTAAALPLALWLAGEVFRMGLLMYGKRLTLPEIWRALRNRA